MSKSKGGTGQGTGKKGWNRWEKSNKAKNAPRIFGKNKSTKGSGGAKK